MSGPVLALILAVSVPAVSVPAQQAATAPSRPPRQGPVYVNAEVIGVDRASGTLTLKSESGTLLSVEKDAAGGLSRLAMGDKVLVTYREAMENGKLQRIVLAVRPIAGEASPPKEKEKPKDDGESAEKEKASAIVVPPAKAPPSEPPPGPVIEYGKSGSSWVTKPVPSVPDPAPRAVVTALPPAGTYDPLASPAATREQGRRDYEGSVRALAPLAGQIDTAWTRFARVCLPTSPAPSAARPWFILRHGGVPPPDDDRCRQSLSEVELLIDELEAELELAEDAARAAEVPPGSLREVRQRYRLDL